MTWRTRVNGRAHPEQRCHECNDRVEPTFKSDPRDAETWFWMECDSCREPVCESCSDMSGAAIENIPGNLLSTEELLEGSKRFCLTCLQSPVPRAEADELDRRAVEIVARAGWRIKGKSQNR